MKYNVLATIGVVIAFFGDILFGAFVLSKVWGWYIVPAFNAPELTIATAVGLKLVMKALNGVKLPSDSDSSDRGLINEIILGFIFNVMLLALSYIMLILL